MKRPIQKKLQMPLNGKVPVSKPPDDLLDYLHVVKGCAVLEVGRIASRFSNALRQRHAGVCFVDLDYRATGRVALHESTDESICFRGSLDALAYYQGGNPFDAVILWDALPYAADLPALFLSIKSLLVADGRFVLYLEPLSLVILEGVLGDLNSTDILPEFYRRRYLAAWLEDSLRQAGFVPRQLQRLAVPAGERSCCLVAVSDAVGE